MKKHIDNIKLFMEKAGQDLPKSPIIPSLEVRTLRATLILEEALETVEALGFSVTIDGKSIYRYMLKPNRKPDLVEIADGCADISVVTYGTALACGLDMEPIVDLVDKSNLEKFGPGGYKRDDGKWVKPANWEAPKIKEELVKQGYK